MKKIFVADDDIDILEVLRLMLESQGYHVEVNTNANVLFEPGTTKPDIILLDIWMSGIDGRDICKRLQATPELQEIPIVFISANSRLPEIAETHQVQGYLSKPFDMSELLAKVSDLTSNGLPQN